MINSHHVTNLSLPTTPPPLVGDIGADDPKDVQVGKLAVRLANAGIFPMVLKSILELGVINVLRDAGKEEDALGFGDCGEDFVLRLLTSYGVVKVAIRENAAGVAERVYGAAPICRFLGMKVGEKGQLLLCCCFTMTRFRLNEVVMEGGVVPFEWEFGMNVFAYPATDQRFNKVLHCAMSNYTTLVRRKVLDVYVGFDDLKVLVDVGSGIGLALGIITTARPHIKGINYDLPHVVTVTPPYPGVEHVGGDMFETVPQGDAIFKKVIILESILPEIPDNDLMMFAQTPGGKSGLERSTSPWR